MPWGSTRSAAVSSLLARVSASCPSAPGRPSPRPSALDMSRHPGEGREMDRISARRDQAATGPMDLIGREPEIQQLRLLVSRINQGAGEALLLSGDPGVGKTSLLDHAAAIAVDSGIRLLRATGSQFEAEISFAALHQLLRPCFAELPHLSQLHAQALNVALGLGEGPPPAQLLVASAVLALLQQISKEQPLLLIVDDLPWLDRASALVLGMVARRLAGLPVALLAACRTGEPSFFDQGNLPVVRVEPLSEESADGIAGQPLSGDDSAGAAAAAGRRPGKPARAARAPGLPRRSRPQRRRNPSRGTASRPPTAGDLRLPRPRAAPLGLRTAAPSRPGRHGRSAPYPGARRRPRGRGPGTRRTRRSRARRRVHRTADVPPPAHPVGDRGAVDQ